MKLPNRYDLLDINVPLMFTDGTAVYEQLGKKYIRHKKGYFILAPSGAGKTYFVDGQDDKHWLDGDELWMLTKAHPEGEWWLESQAKVVEIEQRSDIITIEAKNQGFWIIGSSNVFLKPDAIVIPDWEIHKQWIAKRQTGYYDGGATTEQLNGVIKHRELIMNWEKQGVKRFESVQDAANYLAEQ